MVGVAFLTSSIRKRSKLYAYAHANETTQHASDSRSVLHRRENVRGPPKPPIAVGPHKRGERGNSSDTFAQRASERADDTGGATYAVHQTRVHPLAACQRCLRWRRRQVRAQWGVSRVERRRRRAHTTRRCATPPRSVVAYLAPSWRCPPGICPLTRRVRQCTNCPPRAPRSQCRPWRRSSRPALAHCTS